MKLYGEDLDELQRGAEKAKEIIAGVAGVADLALVKSGESPQMAIKIDRDALARYDLDLDDVQEYIETAMAGHVASEFWEGEKLSTSRCVRDRPVKTSPPSVRSGSLKNESVIPLSAVADVRSPKVARPSPKNWKRYIGVRMSVESGHGSFVTSAGEGRRGAPPPSYQVTWAASSRTARHEAPRLVIPVALVITHLLLFGIRKPGDASIIVLHAFRADRRSFGLAAAGMTLSVSAVGFIALLGQAVPTACSSSPRSGRLRDGESHYDAVAGGARDRLRGA